MNLRQADEELELVTSLALSELDPHPSRPQTEVLLPVGLSALSLAVRSRRSSWRVMREDGRRAPVDLSMFRVA